MIAISRVLAPSLVASALFAGETGAQEPAAEWEDVKHRGQPYVTTQSLKPFYRFEKYDSTRGHLFFSSPDRVMKMRHGTKNLYINNTKFVLSKPIASADGNYLISRMDLTKLVDPVLRPRFIRQSAPFQTVVIDPGHGGKDSGSAGRFGNEKTHALRLAEQVRTELERRNFRVKLTRTGDQELSLAQRVAFANQISDSIFVSLHYNNSRDRRVAGFETYALPPQGAESTLDGPAATDHIRLRGNEQDGQNIALATAVHASVMHEVEVVDRGIRRARWGVLVGIEKPAILVEGGYLSNWGEAQKISSTPHTRQLATAIADGIVNYRNALRK